MSPPDPSTRRRSCPGWEINALKGTARSEHAAASAHKPRAIPALLSSFHRACRCITITTAHHPCRYSTAILRQPGSSALVAVLELPLPVSRSTKDLKLFPILSWISAESSGKKIIEKKISYQLLLFSASRNSRGI